MDVIITEWALDAYLDLRHRNVFSVPEYKQMIRPDAELLKTSFPSGQQFQNNKFWSPAIDYAGNTIPSGFKMKWRQVGSGKVQLRLAVALVSGAAYLCRAYVKTGTNLEDREMERFKIHIRDIIIGNFKHRGVL